MSLQEGLVGHWTMDDSDTSGGTLYDRSGSDNHGDIQGATTDITGVIGNSYRFDGNDDYLDIGEITEARFESADSFTVTHWIYPESQSSDYPMTISPEAPYTTNNIWNFLQNDNDGTWTGEMHFRYSTDSGYVDLSDISVPLNEWSFIAFGYDATVGEGFEYKGTTLIDTSTAEFSPSASYPSEWTIGAGSAQTEYEFDGKIDSVRLYNRALSESEINQLYQMRSQRTSKNKPSNITVNGKDVVLEQDSFGSWILVMNYEHYGGSNPSVSPGNEFPQLPDGKKKIKDIENDGENGELQHVDNISQYGDFQVDAVRLEGETSGHGRKMNFYTKNQTVINAVTQSQTEDETTHSDFKDNVTKYPDHNTFLPDNMGSDDNNQTSADSNHIFGREFIMYGDGSDGTRVHWSVAGYGDRWEMDDFPNGPQNTTIHRVWVRTQIY